MATVLKSPELITSPEPQQAEGRKISLKFVMASGLVLGAIIVINHYMGIDTLGQYLTGTDGNSGTPGTITAFAVASWMKFLRKT